MQVGHADDGAERQLVVGRCQLGIVEDFTGSGGVALQDVAVPGGDAAQRVEALDGADGVDTAELGREALQVLRVGEAMVLAGRDRRRQCLRSGGDMAERGRRGKRGVWSFVVVERRDRKGSDCSAGEQGRGDDAALGQLAHGGNGPAGGALEEAAEFSTLVPLRKRVDGGEMGGRGLRAAGAAGGSGVAPGVKVGAEAGDYRVFSSPIADQNGSCKAEIDRGSCARTRFYVAVVTGTLLL